MLQIYGQSRPEGEGFSDPDIKIPGALGNKTTLYFMLSKEFEMNVKVFVAE